MRELHELGAELIKSRDFSRELGGACIGLSDQIMHMSKWRKNEPMLDLDELAEELMIAFKRKKFPKQEILHMLAQFGGNRMPKSYLAGEHTINQSISYFVESVPREVVYEILSIVGSDKGDEYLKGILER